MKLTQDMRAYQRAYQQARKNKGLCTKCGRASRAGMTTCASCAEKLYSLATVKARADRP